jgi:hypothetical protein
MDTDAACARERNTYGPRGKEQNHGRRPRKRMGLWNTNLEENGTK